MTEQYRTANWLDTLDAEEYAVASRLLAMPGGSHAVAYLGVELHRLRECVIGNPRSRRRDATLGGGVGAVLAAALWMVAEFVRSFR